MNTEVCWAATPLERYRRHIRELFETEVYLGRADVQFFSNGAIVKTDSLHWSRIFEWPWVLDNLPEHHGRWLEVGAGETALQYLLARHCTTIRSLDLRSDRDSIPLACTKLDIDNLYTIQGDVLDLPPSTKIYDHTYDLVVCISTIEHTRDPWRSFNELLRVLKPGGTLLATIDVADRVFVGESLAEEFHCDLTLADKMATALGVKLPPFPADGLAVEIAARPTPLRLNVLCLKVTK